MENALYGSAVLFFSVATYLLLKVIFRFGEPYNTLRGEMEKLRCSLSAGIKAGSYNEKALSETIASFNKEAKRLRMPEFKRRS